MLAEAGADHRHVAALIVDAVVLLEARIVLLVDDDQPEILERQEQRRPCADDHARLAGRHRRPDAAAITRRQRRMPLDGWRTEPPLEPPEELAGQRDLRQHDQRLSATRERPRDGLEVDLGLAGAGDAVEQGYRERGAVDRCPQMLDRGCLGVRELRHGVGRIGPRQAFRRNGDFGEKPGLDQAVDHAGRAVGLVREHGFRPHGAVASHAEGARALRGQSFRRRCTGDDGDAHPRLGWLEGGWRAHHHPRDHAERGQRVARDPLGKGERQRRQRWCFENGVDGFELARLDRWPVADRM